MENKEIPIKEFRAHTAEVLRMVAETKTAYVITNRGQPVVDLVPHGTAVRDSLPLLGIHEDVYDHGWDSVPLQEEIDASRLMWSMPAREWDQLMADLYVKYNPGVEPYLPPSP